MEKEPKGVENVSVKNFMRLNELCPGEGCTRGFRLDTDVPQAMGLPKLGYVECTSHQILNRKESRIPVVALSVSSGKTVPRSVPCAHTQGYESQRLRFGIFDGLH